MAKTRTINVKGTEVTIATRHELDYVSLTDMLKHFGDESILYNWLRNRNTIEFLGIWEQLYNPDFKSIEFDRFRSQAGLNSFALSPKKWIEATGAIGIYAKAQTSLVYASEADLLNVALFGMTAADCSTMTGCVRQSTTSCLIPQQKHQWQQYEQ